MRRYEHESQYDHGGPKRAILEAFRAGNLAGTTDRQEARQQAEVRVHCYNNQLLSVKSAYHATVEDCAEAELAENERDHARTEIERRTK